ncbi:MAG: uracil-xanthine permease family protein [Parascardovia denticolens]
MAMNLAWKLHGDGKHIEPGEVIEPNERLTWPRTTGIGAQHVIAMFGSTFLVPILTGFDPSTTLFFTAMSTALFLLINNNALPSYLGSSFAFIAPIGAVTAANKGMAGLQMASFGILCTGLTLALVGVIVHFAGAKWIDIVMPPVVNGSIVACARGKVDFSAIGKAAWIGLPHFHAPVANFNVLTMFLPVVLVLIAENIGHVKSVSLMTGKNYDDRIGRSLFADGLGTVFAGLGGGSGTTTYAENIGVMAATKVYSTAAYWFAAFFALILSLCPKFGAIINTIPAGVLGGVTTLLYGMIGMLGVRIWVENKVDFAKPVNMSVAAVTMIIGIADFTFALNNTSFNGIAIGTVVALVAYHGLKALGKVTGVITSDSDYIEDDSGQGPAQPASASGQVAA